MSPLLNLIFYNFLNIDIKNSRTLYNPPISSWSCSQYLSWILNTTFISSFKRGLSMNSIHCISEGG